MSWIWAELDFASLYSYRMPNLSPSYALASPVPSPAALRLALVDAAIKSSGKVSYGEEIFEVIKSAKLEIEPPEKVSVIKSFIRRLKPEKQQKGKIAGLLESTGIREYCHFFGPMRVYLEISEREEEITRLFTLLRRLGTTDSIVMCRATVQEEAPQSDLICKEAINLELEALNFAKRPVFTLNEIKPDAKFSQVNPYGREKRGNPYVQKIFVLPLIEERRGENWVLYKKHPFVL
jgi:CRISPR/Cas system-associated protein Cas5 (RAMP superfamily)